MSAHCNEQWWTGEDSNLRSPKGRRVYSPLLLTAQPPVRQTCRPPCGTTLLTASVKAETESIAHSRQSKPTCGAKKPAGAGARAKPGNAKSQPHIVCGRLLTNGRESSSRRLALRGPAPQERQTDQARSDQKEGDGLGDSRGEILLEGRHGPSTDSGDSDDG